MVHDSSRAGINNASGTVGPNYSAESKAGQLRSPAAAQASALSLGTVTSLHCPAPATKISQEPQLCGLDGMAPQAKFDSEITGCQLLTYSRGVQQASLFKPLDVVHMVYLCDLLDKNRILWDPTLTFTQLQFKNKNHWHFWLQRPLWKCQSRHDATSACDYTEPEAMTQRWNFLTTLSCWVISFK